MRNRNMFRCEGRGMGRRFAMMNQAEVEFAHMPERKGMSRGQGFGGQGCGRAQGFGRENRCR